MALTPDLIIDDEIRYLITKYAALQGNSLSVFIDTEGQSTSWQDHCRCIADQPRRGNIFNNIHWHSTKAESNLRLSTTKQLQIFAS